MDFHLVQGGCKTDLYKSQTNCLNNYKNIILNPMLLRECTLIREC